MVHIWVTAKIASIEYPHLSRKTSSPTLPNGNSKQFQHATLAKTDFPICIVGSL